MKIGIFFDSSENHGGVYHHNINIVDIFNEYISDEFEIIYIVQNEEIAKILEKKNCKTIKLKKIFILKIEKFLFKFNFIREMYNKLSISNSFEKIIKKNKFDLLFFNTPHEMSTLITETNFIIYLLSMQHKTLNFFPEYKGSHHNLDLRDHIVGRASNFAFKILVGANKDKYLLNQFYNTDLNKIIVQPYTFTLPYIFEKNKNYDYEKTFTSLSIPNKKIFLYPAQFWAHKNHKYIIDVALDFKKNNISDVIFVLCGFDKGNLKYIRNQIEKNNLNDYFKIFNYLTDLELIALYLKCFLVLMPSYVGHTAIPMYEAFYFKKNIFFTEGLADKYLEEFLTAIDIMKPSTVRSNYLNIIKNPNENNIKLNKAKSYFDKYLNKENMAKTFINIFNEYKHIKERWKD